MTYAIKRESVNHSIIVCDGRWIATVNTKDAPGRVEAVLKAIEEHAAAEKSPE